MLSPGGELDENSERVELFLESRRMYRDFVEELSRISGEAIDYQESGAIDLAYSSAEWDTLLRRQAQHSSFGIRSRGLTAAQVGVLSPHASTEGLAGALFYPDDGAVSPRDLMRALRRACEVERVDIRENNRVTQVRISGGDAVIGDERFSHAVVAAGAWSGSLQIEGAEPIPAAEPVRGHVLSFDLPLGACPTIIRRGHTYVFQRGSGLVVAGASMEQVGFDRTVDWATVSRLSRDVTHIMPLLGRLEPLEVWTGFRPHSTRIQLGRWRETPLFLAYGHYRNGILLAPATARLLCDEILASAGGAAASPKQAPKQAHG
jgi:glycine oxidase